MSKDKYVSTLLKHPSSNLIQLFNLRGAEDGGAPMFDPGGGRSALKMDRKR